METTSKPQRGNDVAYILDMDSTLSHRLFNVVVLAGALYKMSLFFLQLQGHLNDVSRPVPIANYKILFCYAAGLAANGQGVASVLSMVVSFISTVGISNVVCLFTCLLFSVS